MSKNDLDLSVVVVSWNVRDYLAPCLRSIQTAINGLQAEIFVVDNASKDGSAWMVAQDFPEITLIANRQNLGFGRANNQALRLSRGKYVLLINPDTLVPPDAIHMLMDFLDTHPQTGIVGPEQRDEHGGLQLNWVRVVPRVMVEYAIEQLASLGRKRTRILFSRPRQVSILNGGCWLVRNDAMEEIGFFDKDLFLYGEEPDVCNRMRAAGWEIWLQRTVEILHYRRKSIKQRGSLAESQYFLRSMAIWLKKRWVSQ